MRLYAFFIVFLSIMVTIAVVGGHGGTSSKGEPLPPDLAVDRIAYVAPDGQVWTVDPDGTHERKVSPDEGFFTWPTWSPDGLRLAFSGIVADESDEQRAKLFTRNLFTNRLQEVHAAAPGVRRLVASGAPHYVNWAPDGRHVAFLGPTEETLALYVDNVRDSAPPVSPLDRAPIYIAWSPDSQSLLVHHGADHVLIDVADLGDEPQLLGGRGAGLAYRAPSWKPPGQRFGYLAPDLGGGYTLYSSSTTSSGDTETLVADLPFDAAFLWAPDGRALAVTTPDNVLLYEPFGLRVFRRISVLTDENPTPVEIEDDNVVAFFWSPDSKKLALVTVAAPGALRWDVLEVATGTRLRLQEFVPSADQLTVLQFFDQFAGSHQIWSPDSESIVFAGVVAGQAVSASTRQQASKVIVLGTGGDRTVDLIADGILGFWSPR